MRKTSAKYSPYHAENFTAGWTMVVHHVSLDVADTIASARLNIGSNGKKPKMKASGYRQRSSQDLRAEPVGFGSPLDTRRS